MQAAKKKRKGRPRKANVARTDNGRISRAREPKEDTRMVALQARERHTGLPAALASHEKACTVLGRLWLCSRITTPMREAGERYLAWQMAMRRAIKAPDGLAKGGAPSAGGDLITEDYVEWAIGAVARYEVAKAWLTDIGMVEIVETVVCSDQECNEGGLPYLRLGLSHLAKRMGIEAQIAA